MTAEVAVMNRMGVALAADSAVTIGTRALASKIYTSAEKLFQLSEVAPVGIMIYGNAGYVSLPWETIIKAFRRRLGRTVKNTVRDYCDEFVAFLRNNPELFPDKARSHVMTVLLYSLLSQVRYERESILDSKLKAKQQTVGTSLEIDEIRSAFTEAIEAIAQIVQSSAKVEGLDAATEQEARLFVNGAIQEVNQNVFDEVERPEGSLERLSDLAVEYLTRQSLRDFMTGIVIAGFGEKEYMPALATFEVEECVCGSPRMGPIKVEAILGAGRPAYVMPFAQQDAVFHFLLGMDSDVSDFMAATVREMTYGLVKVILEKVAEADGGLAEELRSPVTEDVGEKLKQLFEGWNDQQARYFRPVLETIAVLPKDELAAVAEAFVNLTKFKRRVGPGAETVSGPIDVAVITKGDGFVWIRRKHYFAPEINPRVIARFHHAGEVQ